MRITALFFGLAALSAVLAQAPQAPPYPQQPPGATAPNDATPDDVPGRPVADERAERGRVGPAR
jgi:hypothetical protein